MRPGRIERHIYVPPPDAESRKKIFAVYLHNAEAILTPDISVDDLVKSTDGYVGADIEAVVREAKLGAMREFITVMAGKPDQEMADAVVNVRITRKHFEDALKKVKGSLDQDALEAAERQAWEMLFNHEQREILENAVAALKMAELRKEPKDDTADLRARAFARTKDFNEIKRLTLELEDRLNRRA
ncbi:MAG: AAA family ATPase, partial [Methanoregulaceae archaeon]|nr:AAA family ATPase [Methanoregulaceae archaeon]